jgi:Flp pilus assembly pilin Flp
MAKTPASNNQTPDETPGEPEVTPTEQLPTEQFPTDAPAAGEKTPVNSGANGYSDLTRADTQPSVFRRHPLATGVTAGVIAVVLISGLTAWGVGTAVTSSLTSSTSAVTPQSTATPAPATGTNGAAGRLKAAGREAFRATIQSMSGDTWTILTKKGQTVTVDVTSSTQFGTRKTAETSGSFAVGDSVIIIATKGTAGTATATRVVSAAAVQGQTSPNAPAPSSSATPTA